MKENKINSADGVRGFALMIVVVMHATGLFFPSLHDHLGGTGQPGVWLFFVLSAFLLTHKYINTGFSVLNTVSYFLGRTIRILPIFYMAVIIYWLMGFYDVEKMKSIISFDSTYIHLWTIPVEFKFYFLLPVIVYIESIIQRVAGRLYSLLFLVLLTLAFSIIYPYTSEDINGRLPFYIPVFMYGVIVAFVYNYFKVKVSRLVCDGLSIVIVFMFVILTPPFQGVNGWLGNKFVLLGPFIAIFIYLQVLGHGYVSMALSSKVMTYLGKYSFSIYLFHIMIIFIIYPTFINNIAAYLVTIALCIGGGVVAYHCVESPLESFRHKLMNKIAGERQR
ncbi:acyltransferase [Enterobacter asburiae]|uniref:acyltransferase family protein n=1 Tax=Enterobacter asburiae TaxID=61645 RepID=UPI003075EEAE